MPTKEYYATHREELNEYSHKYYSDNRELIKKHNRKYGAEHLEERKKHDRKYRKLHREELLKRNAEYNKIHHKERHEYGEHVTKRKYKELRKRALDTLGGRVCSNCGCDVYELLEINHINGKGSQEVKERFNGNRQKMYREIVDGSEDTTNYNVLCKLCNWHHHIETNLGITGHTVTWKQDD
jgi:hypothetical protein